MQAEQFDTLLFLMNGIGIAKTVDSLSPFFKQIQRLLKRKGQVLLDSSDLIYLYEDEIPDENSYYGEIEYAMSYKGETSASFSWLYLDFETLKTQSKMHGFDCELLVEDDHYGFLAKLTLD